MKEHEYHKGYYYLPLSESPVIINREGDLINLHLNHYHPIYIDHRGYVVTPLKFGYRYFKNYAVHRLLALLFVPKPERHADKVFTKLQVNHRDGVKTNNTIENLEWVTGKENMEHARALGLFDNEKIVLSRDIRTNEIVRYKSISDCARSILVPVTALSHHLNSISAGRITKDWMVFKFDDIQSWPTLLAFECEENTLGYVADVIAENVVTKEVALFVSLKQACECLKLNAAIVKNNRARKGYDTPYQGWIFYPLSHYLEMKREPS